MEIKLIAFGIARDILQERSIVWPVERDSTIADVKEALQAAFPAFAKLRSLRCAVNEDYVPDSHVVRDGDEVVLIPPVSGG
ncbi:MAG: MoaD/ThiS family protein [Saprospiraceae bacterium]|nr:MoaD/ThiS family protein [Saprospiraceae bacterium]